MNVIRKKNEPPFFIARTYQYGFFYCANLFVFLLRELNQKKIASFYCTNWENVFTSRTKEKKNLFTARTCVLLLRELNQKKNSARTCVWSHEPSSEKKNFFYCTNSIKISWEIITEYVRKKKRHFVLCELQKKIDQRRRDAEQESHFRLK